MIFFVAHSSHQIHFNFFFQHPLRFIPLRFYIIIIFFVLFCVYADFYFGFILYIVWGCVVYGICVCKRQHTAWRLRRCSLFCCCCRLVVFVWMKDESILCQISISSKTWQRRGKQKIWKETRYNMMVKKSLQIIYVRCITK